MLAALDAVLHDQRPDWVLLYGDTNSTVAGALAGAKLNLPVAHLEAGLRPFDRTTPEELNRVVTDHAADLCLAPTELALRHLAGEGLAARSVLVDDGMTDVCRAVAAAVRGVPPPLPAGVAPAQPYLLATVHRAENTYDPDRLRAVLDALAAMPLPVVLLPHPRLSAPRRRRRARAGPGQPAPAAPVALPAAGQRPAARPRVVTDSGGLQKEAFLLGVPCPTVRERTEWPETLVDG